MKSYKYTGNISLFFGFLASMSCFTDKYIFYGLILSFLGFVFSVINIFIATKLQLEKGILSKGYISILLSSFPVIRILYLIFIMKH